MYAHMFLQTLCTTLLLDRYIAKRSADHDECLTTSQNC